ncbi:hypothetical protein C5S42_07985 [Candidatus Methanomarinus sp.]|nr:hypothetical protein C5S42_07985 [ANME-2 cluster archaeon]
MEAQVYSRKIDRDIRDPATDIIIGHNEPITFEFTTRTLIFVPAGPKGVGDKQGEGTIENSIGAINEGWI